MIDRLEELAKAATAGEWTLHVEDLRGGRYFSVRIPGFEPIDIHEDDDGEATAAFIALANPSTILKLCAEIRRLEARARAPEPK